MSVANQADFTFSAANWSADDLRVTAFEGFEAISALFRFHVSLCSSQTNLDLAELLGKPCTLELATEAGSRPVNGILASFERTGEGSGWTYYAAEVTPVHWLLSKRTQSRVFESARCPDMSIPGIIQKVFTDAGIPTDNYRFALTGEYRQREFVAQYRESDLDFVCRLMENEGIFFFFEHTADKHCMVIGDRASVHTANPQDAEFRYRSPNSLAGEQEFVHHVRDRREIQSGAVCLDDFDFHHPATELRSRTHSENFQALEFREYPGGFVEKAEGDRYATLRLEEQECRRQVVQMATTVRGILPGFKFSIFEHPVEALNREFLALEVTHRGTQPQSTEEEAPGDRGARYEGNIRAIPADVPFRPPLVTPRPFVRGSQTALVVGPSGEEIYTDAYGRVKVQFHWDQDRRFDENSSFWIRVSQGSAGGQYGMMFLPRVGQEVIVDFLEGDPDRPIITGRVYNNDQMPPYTLPDEKTKSCIKTNTSPHGRGTNEIRFEDAKDNEQVLIYAQRDLHMFVEHDRVETVMRDRHLTVNENKDELVRKAKANEVTLDFTEKIGGDKSLDVKGAVKEKFGGNHEEQAASLSVKADRTIVLDAGQSLVITAGGNFVKIDSSGVYISGTKVYINSGGSGGNGSDVTPANTQDVPLADRAVPGHDVTYRGDASEMPPIETEEAESSWIEIELVDESGLPVAGEKYEITCPDGTTIKEGFLDSNGRAHVGVPTDGSCEIRFPNLDGAAWKRL